MPRARASRSRATPLRSTSSITNESRAEPQPPAEPTDALITDTLKKIKDGGSLTGPFVEKLAAAYRTLNQSKRQVFQNKLVLEVQRCLAFLHEINQKDCGQAFFKFLPSFIFF